MDKYWVWLEESMLISKDEKGKMLILYKTPRKIYEALNENIEIQDRLKKELLKTDEIIKSCRQGNIYIVTPFHKMYKPCAHFIVYIKGSNISSLSDGLHAILGTRTCSSQGLMNAKSICKKWIEENSNLSGGLSGGIEKQVRACAQELEGVIVLFMSRGIRKSDFHRQNELLISPFPPNKEAGKYAFHKRNNLLIAWSDVFILIEASLESGAYKLARKALNADKAVYVIETLSKAHSFSGNRALLEAGAKPYMNIWNDSFKSLSNLQRDIMIFLKDNPQSTDSIINHLQEPVKAIDGLLDLQMKGFLIFGGDGLWR